MRTLLLYASNFFNETTQESKYRLFGTSLEFLLESLLRKVQNCNEQLFIAKRVGGGGGGTGGGLRVEGFLLVCLNLCIRNYLYPVPSGYPTAYEELLYAEEFFE